MRLGRVQASPIAAWAGHTSVSVVLNRYGHLFPGHEDAVMQRLAEGYTPPVVARSWHGRAANAKEPGPKSGLTYASMCGR